MTLAARSPISDVVSFARASDHATATAGGTGDATQVTGQIIDRATYGYPQSATAVIEYKAVLAAAATLSYAYTIEHSDASDMSGAATLASATSTLQDTGGGGGTTQRGVLAIPLNLGPAKRYLRVKFTPDLSAGSVDTLENAAVLAFGN
ncbi:hypothetical protein Acid345_3172 [Candidatus Koribacter versatilis Ellin345]|uniref:Uncharacterized protein n=1 Tax=Koribacter versatilis (strain Ellin345) TaxID=204669 RepID=Q1ILS7_KORVE|nr:hypothetical protein [Candidatus Koribacter versatilis]ABF42173.1 hypothetical protein Acid345_3172 [Candidatus Koribacter versatilis Ellin345]